MSNTETLRGLRQARTGPEEESKRLDERRRSLEEKTKILEEKARTEKLSIDKKLLVQILEEENATHDAAVKELEERIANMERELKSSPTTESTPSEAPPEPSQETSQDVDEGVSVSVLDQPEQPEVAVPQEGSTKKKKRSSFF